jgi:hypothetical protein
LKFLHGPTWRHTDHILFHLLPFQFHLCFSVKLVRRRAATSKSQGWPSLFPTRTGPNIFYLQRTCCKSHNQQYISSWAFFFHLLLFLMCPSSPPPSSSSNSKRHRRRTSSSLGNRSAAAAFGDAVRSMPCVMPKLQTIAAGRPSQRPSRGHHTLSSCSWKNIVNLNNNHPCRVWSQAVVLFFLGENTITLPILLVLFCILSFSHGLKHRRRRDHIEPRRPLSTPPRASSRQDGAPTRRTVSKPYHVRSSGAQPAARSKSSPSICRRPEHTSGRTAAFYSCLMFALSSSALLQVTNHTSQPSWVSIFIHLSRMHVRIRNLCL